MLQKKRGNEKSNAKRRRLFQVDDFTSEVEEREVGNDIEDVFC